jgi:aryl-alcohol dehydrogenase-like predicted oxidoreductase
MMSFGNRSSRAWHLDEEQAEPLVRKAVEAGVTFFDTADMYDRGASEEVTGRLLRRAFADREDYVLATKVYYPTGDGPNDKGLSRKHILAAIDASLRRLGTDYIDLYQIHRWDYETPIEETMAALHDVVRAGKARYLGASSMFAWQFAQAQHTAQARGWSRFAAMQHHYNLAYREEEREMAPYCVAQGVGLLPYSPLARGFLVRPPTASTARSGNDPLADRFFDSSDFAVVEALRTVAAARGVPPAQVALAWLLSRPGVVAPIVGATRPHHIDDAIAAVDLELTEPEIARLEEPYRPHKVLGHS